MDSGYERSSGNVFADAGLPNAGQEQVRAELSLQIYRLLRDRGLLEADAAALLGATPTQISALMRCRPTSAPIGRLLQFLNALGQDVELTLRPAGVEPGHVSVTVQPGP